MANDLATLNGYLDTQLREDTTDAVWTSAHKNNLLTWAIASLWPRFSRELPYATTTITLAASTYVYNAPSGVMLISRLDWVNSDGDEMGPMDPGSWETLGDPLAGVLRVHVSPTIADAEGTLRVIGYGRYDTSSNLIPDEYVPLVLAKARAEAYRELAGNRVQFEQWAARNAVQDTSVNEIVQLVNEADAEIARLTRTTGRTWQRPVPGRHG